jgi:hypothetical protein
MLEEIDKQMTKSDGGLLLGRLRCESMLSGWNAKDGPCNEALNKHSEARRIEQCIKTFMRRRL